MCACVCVLVLILILRYVVRRHKARRIYDVRGLAAVFVIVPMQLCRLVVFVVVVVRQFEMHAVCMPFQLLCGDNENITSSVASIVVMALHS